MALLEYERDKEMLTVCICSEIDHHTAVLIREKTDELIESTPTKFLRIDFSRVTFMDSSGIGYILGRYKLVKKSGGEIEIINASGYIEKSFGSAG